MGWAAVAPGQTSGPGITLPPRRNLACPEATSCQVLHINLWSQRIGFELGRIITCSLVNGLWVEIYTHIHTHG
jgi:hypothetical protein